jgi:RES domain-containing protein
MALHAARVATAPRSSFAGTLYRHQAPQYDPRSGEGARINGGRFNPPDSFPVLYLCETRPCAVAEFRRLARIHLVGIEGFLPRVLYQYELDLDRVLDLTDADTREQLSISITELTDDDWSLCQTIGTESHASGDQAILAPSATGVDRVLAVFPELLGSGLHSIELSEEWNSPIDL